MTEPPVACTIKTLTLSHPDARPWWVKSSGVRQSKITKGTDLAGVGLKGLKKEIVDVPYYGKM